MASQVLEVNLVYFILIISWCIHKSTWYLCLSVSLSLTSFHGTFVHDPSVLDRYVGDDAYLVADFSLLCLTPEWNTWAIVAAFATLVYPIGIPIIFFILLRRARQSMNTLATRMPLGFLFEGYHTTSWWFELAVRTPSIVYNPMGGWSFVLWFE
jgi:hypothetical protein